MAMNFNLNDLTLFASTAKGLEELLKHELESLGATSCKIIQGGVYFQANMEQMYYCLMWSRLASRILLPIKEFAVHSDMDLYLGVNTIDWPALFNVNRSFVVSFSGTNDEIRNSQYGALRVKDAIVDVFMRRTQQRPTIDKRQPDLRIAVYLNKSNAILSLDLSGDSLHLRGYRSATGKAPIKENLASAIIMRSGWLKTSPMIDPMCGSGTLLIEAALMAADIAPQLARRHWGFYGWLQHDESIWRNIIEDAEQRATIGLSKVSCNFYGYDKDKRIIDIARHNARQAGVDQLIHFGVQDLSLLTNPLPDNETGIIISNPPYGERLESEPALIALYTLFGQRVKYHFPGWRLSLFSASPALLSCLQLRSERQFKAKNGALDCVQKNYLLSHDGRQINSSLSVETNVPSERAIDYANRLKKNSRKLDKWAQKEGITCYRLYDADLPEYNVAIDRYGEKVVIQEYAAPKTIDPQKARQRLFDVINATLDVLQLKPENLVLKVREKQKGKQQYQKLAQKGEFFLVSEYNARLWVNLTDYIDTGLFLDHRLVRRRLGKLSKGKDFLNLFAYTGSATVHAGLGGAKTTTTVDMSRTYLEWAERNLQANHLTGRQHRLIQADCLSWLQQTNEQFDIIFIDPPTFSNSKRMKDSFDIQRDHIELLAQLVKLLRQNGTIVFSNNKRGFKFDHEAAAVLGFSAENITEQTLSPDFERNKKIHNCWLIHHKIKE